MKDELGEEILKEFAGFCAKKKKQKTKKKCVSKEDSKLKDVITL